MKTSFAWALVLVFAGALAAHASVTLQVNDTVTFINQVNGASAGDGGAFQWQIASVVASPASSPKGTYFQTFCDELQQTINPGDTYTVSAILPPQLHQVINSSNNVLNDFQGLYLFDEWNNGISGGTMLHNSANAAAVQVAIWESEGYNLSDDVLASLGYGHSKSYYDNQIQYWLGQNLPSATVPYSSSWSPSDVSAIELTYCGDKGAQDQIVLVPGTESPHPAGVPEPVSLAVWGIGAGLAGLAASWRRTQSRGRWSDRNRREIIRIIEGKR